MALLLYVNGPEQHVKLSARGKPPTNNKLPIPPGTIPTWSGFNDAVATHTMDADSLGVTFVPVAQGALRITATVEGFMPAALDIEVGAEQVDHFEIEVG